jgi:biopolymer transport protein ExbB
MNILDLFKKGGPIMWPLLIASVTALTVVIERVFFMIVEMKRRDQKTVEKMLFQIKIGETDTALELGKNSQDCIAKMLVRGIEHEDEQSLSDALMHAASEELKRYERGLAILDTIITLAPLLGLLGTVTGMIHAFGLLGNQELGSPTAITGGIAEALIATAFGLGIAITALIPFNSLNAHLDKMRHQFESAGTRLELMTRKSNAYETSQHVR